MKRMRTALGLAVAALALFAAGTFAGCSSDGGSASGENKIDESLPAPEFGYLRINTLAAEADNLWIWNDFDPSATAECKTWDDTDGGYRSNKGANGDFVYFDVKLLDAPQQVGFIVRKGSSKLSGEADIIYMFPAKYNQVFLKKGSGTVYIDKDFTEEPKGLAGAEITGENSVSPKSQGVTLSKDNVKVFGSDGTTEFTVESVSNSKITVAENLKEKGTVYAQYTDEAGTDRRIANFASNLIDEWFDVDEEKIAKFGYKNGIFTTWAPLATTAKVLLFADSSAVSGDGYKVAAEIPMTRNADGTWQTDDVSAQVGANKYYKYSFMNNGVQYDVCDIWAKAASKDSRASAIEQIPSVSGSLVNPFGENGSKTMKYSDAVIYEMHITDWSQAFRGAVQKDNPGTFREIAQALGSNGSGPFGQHLKDLGVTHVQILPMFEYAVTTKRSESGETPEDDSAYNWGYNPYNWNTPESRYVQDMNDGSDAVEQMKEMVDAFHDAGIAVIMDVVYNHTSGTGSGSIYDMTVPKYFYRMDAQGNYANGSGCGNETASDHKMVRKFMVDSLKHWVKDYGINGFRFDLMGLHDKETMSEIYNELYDLDKNILVYGEPWTGNSDDKTAISKNASTISAGKGTDGYGYGAFDDDFRDAIKGAEFGGFNAGQVQGSFADDGIAAGLTGKSGKNSRNTTGIPGLALHYVECHDNFTLYDKLVYSLDLQETQAADKDGKIATAWPAAVSEEQLGLIRKQDKLAAAYVLLSQGTPFINGGQEFLRTKKGNPDSYAADKKGGKFWSNIDEVNTVDLGFKEEYSDVYNTYKGLIALRKSSTAFTDGSESTAETLAKGVTLYRAKSGPEEFDIYFNASDAEFTIPGAQADGLLGLGVSSAETSFGAKGNLVEIDETTGEVKTADAETTVCSVPAKSFVILKK